MWKYNISLGEWTWVSGANIVDQNGNYGTKGMAMTTNIPGARQAMVSWTDNSGNFWFFGGYGFPASGAHSYLNDLWKYDVGANQWTWISGTDLTNQAATYGTKGIANANNIPGARQMSVAWKDNVGNFWMFGAWGYIGPPFGRLNDLWNYNIGTNQWTWIAGVNTVNPIGTYGTLGLASTSNIPGSRRMSVSWADNTGKFWMFGGNGYDAIDSLGLLNDLWKIDVGVSNEIHSFSQNGLTINYYPNPFAAEITIEIADSKKHSIQIFDLTGRVFFTNAIENKTTIDMSAYAAGVYFIRMEGITQKVIKN